MTHSELRALFDREMRFGAETRGFVREESDTIVRHISEHQEKGFVIYSALTEKNVLRTIHYEKERFRRAGQEFEWKAYSYDTPTDLIDHLVNAGFQREDPEALMIMKLEREQPLLNEDTSEVVELSDEKGIQDVITLENTIWEESHSDLGMRLYRELLRIFLLISI